MYNKKTIIALLCAICLIATTGFLFAGASDPKVPVINKAVNGRPTVDYLDEDDMTTDSNGAVASQQSIKAYVDNQDNLLELSGTTVGGYTVAASYIDTYDKFVLGATNVFVSDAELGNETPCALETEGGVTVTVPTPTATTDGWEITLFYGGTSATSQYVIYSGGLPIGDASATTPYSANTALDFDAIGDSITIVADYDSEVSWWVKSYHIQ